MDPVSTLTCIISGHQEHLPLPSPTPTPPPPPKKKKKKKQTNKQTNKQTKKQQTTTTTNKNKKTTLTHTHKHLNWQPGQMQFVCLIWLGSNLVFRTTWAVRIITPYYVIGIAQEWERGVFDRGGLAYSAR